MWCLGLIAAAAVLLLLDGWGCYPNTDELASGVVLPPSGLVRGEVGLLLVAVGGLTEHAEPEWSSA